MSEPDNPEVFGDVDIRAFVERMRARGYAHRDVQIAVSRLWCVHVLNDRINGRTDWHCECRMLECATDVDENGVCADECGSAECYRAGPVVDEWRVPRQLRNKHEA